MKNKKGDVSDPLVLAFWIFFFAIGITALVYVFTQIWAPIQNSVIGSIPEANSTINSAITYTQVAIPSTLLIIFFGLMIGLFVSAFFVRSNPIFIPFYIMFGLASILVTVMLGNAWGAISALQQFSDTINLNATTRLIGLIMNNIVKIQVVAFIISLIILFAKPSQSGGATPY